MEMKKALIVEDEKEIASVIEDILNIHDIEAIVALEGIAALHILENQSISFIISDISLPDIDGFELYESIKSKYPALKSQFLFMSGYSPDEKMERFLSQSGNSFIQKPFHINDLQQKLEKYL